MTSTGTVGTRLHRHLFETERRYPQATGELSALLSQLALAGKRIARLLSRAGLAEILGPSGHTNVQGEEQQKLDALANDIFLEAFAYGQLVPTVVTEEMDLPARLPENEAVAASAGKYVVFVDPLDGSSNLDINGAVGSIFSVRRIGGSGPIHSEAELLARISQEQVVAGYFVYGPATMLVYTAGPKAGVQGFTLDPGIGEFLLSHPDIRIPRRGTYYACNEGFISTWPEGPRRFVEALRTPDPARSRPRSTRYSGALVVDVHRILLRGGIFLYPGTDGSPEGKLRLMYEAAPLAAVVEAAGGLAIDGRKRIVSIFPEENHQRTPLYIGSREDVEELEKTIASAPAS